ncbi:RNHCP domain-containing protein [Patescibacteria group bacterium]|nr:RNHCP domain-containing protein [Patescibacteria group bacterium]
MSNLFTVINEEFACSNCGHFNKKLPGSCRNHCTKCLYSLHLDKDAPGDRASTCHSPMQPIFAEQSGKKGWMIYHKCKKCAKIIPNKAADDDNFDIIIELTQKPQAYEQTGIKKARKKGSK